MEKKELRAITDLLDCWSASPSLSKCHQWEHRPALTHSTKRVKSVLCLQLLVPFALCDELKEWTWNDKRRRICTIPWTRDLVSDSLCVLAGVCVCVRACRGIHCQDSDRFLFVHKLLLVISSIFETIKQRRENGWLGNPWILICQQNENESGRWWKCAEWEVTADMRKEQTFFFFVLFVPDCSHLLLSQVHTMACDLLPRVWNCSECEWKCQWDSCARCTSNKYKIWRQKKKKNPQASDRLCYDCTSGYGLHSSQQASRL